jgi:DNA-binding MarR family transcriptional regulator
MTRTPVDPDGAREERPRDGVDPGASGAGAPADSTAESPCTAAAPRWLDADELAAWLANSAIMISLPAALDARMQRESRLTFFEYMVLSVLSEQTGHTMQMSALAARTASSLSRLSHVVARLEQRGLLTRSRVPGAGRRTNTTLTDAGHEVVVAAAPGHVAAVREYLIDDLQPEDLRALRRIGTAVEAAIGRARLPAGPAGAGAGTD